MNASDSMKNRPRRRVVTGYTPAGRSMIVSDGPPAGREWEGDALDDHWIIESMPPPLDEVVFPVDSSEYSLEPPPGGIVCRTVFIEPGLSADKSFMHATETLDFLVVVSGEVTLIMEEGEVTLYPGEAVIQRGTVHAWMNRGSEPCVMADVMISTKRQV